MLGSIKQRAAVDNGVSAVIPHVMRAAHFAPNVTAENLVRRVLLLTDHVCTARTPVERAST